MACGGHIGSTSGQNLKDVTRANSPYLILRTGPAFPAYMCVPTFPFGLLGVLWLLAPGRAREDARAVNTQQ